MVFPLLGILGLAASAYAKPFYDEWAEEKRGGRARDALAGVGGDMGSQSRALMEAGLLNPADFMSGQFDIGRLAQGQQGLEIDRERLGLQRDQFGLDRLRYGQDERRMAMDHAFRMSGRYDYAPIGEVTPDLMAAAKEAIAMKESGGAADPYRVLGPVTPSGDRAWGKYQVMGNNIPQWTEAAGLGRMTPEQYLASDEAQERVFEHRMGGYLNQYGNFEDAASVWFSGRPVEQAMRETPQGDGYSTTADYVGQTAKSFNRRMGINQQAREREQAGRELEIAQADAAAPMREGAGRADTVLQGLDQLGRFGSGYLNSAEGKALSDQTSLAAEELFHTWRKSVYGEAEPSPQSLEQFRTVFPEPGGNLASRERQARYFATMRAEMNKRADYEEAKLARKHGLISAEELRAYNGGRLTREEREELASGNLGNLPKGFKERSSVEIPDKLSDALQEALPEAKEPPRYYGRGGGVGRSSR